jgi:CRISPR-associated endonuclease/helicase Cas3
MSLLLFVIALHDLGKYTPAFQAKLDWARRLLPQHGFDINPPAAARHHGKAGLGFIRDALCEIGIAPSPALKLARAVAAHHGEFPKDALLTHDRMSSRERGKAPRWNDARRQAIESLRSLFKIEHASVAAFGHSDTIRLAGLTSVADWIGSMETVFAYEAPPRSLDGYWPVALERAEHALQRVGIRPYITTPARSFVELFPAYRPWPLHAEVESLAARLSGPSLVVIEAPMGEGKTEAALLLANSADSRLGQQGIYIGLPTKATANQMFGRVRRFLDRVRPAQASTLALAHGDAEFVAQFQSLIAVYDDNSRDGGVAAEEWFLSKKRTLLAEHAVGTIDQALLGVLRTRHGFVRLYGLAGKTVVLDEVHAYDTFTSRILDELIEWLGALGTTVVLLSATLPRARRRALLAAYARGLGSPPSLSAPPEACYPRISAMTRDGCTALPIPQRGSSIAVQVERVDTDIPRLAEAVVSELRDGGCVGWICNTVDRAQKAFAAVARIAPEIPLVLLHARMLPEERQARERRIETQLGPEDRSAKRPERCLVIGTQVLEQSLDVDFDLLISDLAPIDLLLQRAGRLHRHRDRRNRSPAHRTPRMLIAYATGAFDTVPIRDVAAVYADVLIRETLKVLQGRTRIALPDEIESLVEAVYREDLPSADDRLFGGHQKHLGEKIASRRNAEGKLLPSPEIQDDIFGKLTMPFDDDEDPTVHEELRAITRDAERTVQMVCLVGRRDGIYISEADLHPIDLDAAPSREDAVRIARRRIGVSHRTLVGTLLTGPAFSPIAWQKRPLLRHCRAVVFHDSVAAVGGTRLELHPQLGLLIGSAADGDAT